MAAKRWVHVVFVALALTAAGCSLPEDQTGEPSGNSVVSAPGGDVAIGGPASSPAASPSPDPGATPTPQPAPSPYGNCSLPPSNGAGAVCTDEPGHLADAVTAAIDRVTKSRPGLFDFNDSRCNEGCYRVLNVSGYYTAVQKELSARGICTFTDSEEVAAKDSNESSEQFDILLASGHIRRGPGMYRGICRPATF
jgi:hypothetical protein